MARPVQVTVELLPPTRAPRAEVPLNGPENVTVEVATLANVLAPLKYGMLPTTAAVEVERPLKEIAFVVLTRGHEKVSGFSGVYPKIEDEAATLSVPLLPDV